MYNKFKIVKVDSKYCDYLRQFDNKVPYNAFNKELRPFLGILFIVNDVEYFVPLSSPKEKQATPKVAFVFLGPLTKVSPALAGSRARQRGKPEFTL